MALVHSGKCNIALEHAPFEDVFSYWKWGYSIAMLVYQRVSQYPNITIMAFAVAKTSKKVNQLAGIIFSHMAIQVT